ncbi:hydroxypyruvate isomerase [Virgisporangium aliadipatigenens]|uniref:Hydroxypyruvate isomerase n=1 Tax=Virgisporangium aliadipatigenens TaxID=741659 RepID=A0A8J4DP05_9ACTN|nr:TIM barrel protein [Virgisporangium aliadipatigenens]GIJ45445.1 hydroxypyruvate isomerase [Virgisporangium aliadipatigenens]
MDGLRFDVNLSILFTELPLLERPAAARAAGFDAIEFWWPFPVAVPDDADVDRFVDAVAAAGVSLVGLNFFAGDLPAGDRGLLSWPGRRAEFRDSVAVAIDIAERLGCPAFNALYGNRVDGYAPAAQDELALENLTFAGEAAARIGASVLLEPLSGAPRYPLRRAADALAVLDRLPRRTNLRLLADLYHLAVNGDDLGAVVRGLIGRIGHVQLADAPGRHEPGTGALDVRGLLTALGAAGYTGHVGLEYVPSVSTVDSFGWLRVKEHS